jgi:hypothetical protein
MANEFKNAKAPNATRAMLTAKINELKSSTDQLSEGHELDYAYWLVSAISKKPYQFHIGGPLRIFPDWTNDRQAIIVGPEPVPTNPAAEPADSPGGEGVGVTIQLAPDGIMKRIPSKTTVQCPNCKHKLKIDISL